MWQRLFSKDYRRRTALQKAAPGIMQDFLAAPFPHAKRSCQDVEIAAVDMETTGLDPDQDRILSIGLVLIKGMSINLADAWQANIRSERSLPEETVVIHGITDDQSAKGQSLEAALSVLLSKLTGRILLVHNASLEQRFLDRACLSIYKTPFIIPTIDTQALARRRFDRSNLPIKSGDLRLFNLREHYNLPRYNAHNALSDALATAELFLAIAAEISPHKPCRLKDVLSR